MITGLSPANQQFVTSIDNLQSQLNNAQNQLSTGLRVNQASDAPQQIGDIFQARSDLGSVNQVIQNLNYVQAQVNAGDSAIQSAVQLLQNASVLGSQGAGTNVTQSQRNALATQIQGILSQVVGLANTQANGVYIFGGDAPQTQPYQVDSASATGVDRAAPMQATQQIQDPTGITFPISQTAQDIFDKRDSTDNPAPENVFAALNNLQLALQAGDTTAIGTALDSLNTASDYLNQQAGFYGTAQNRISSAISLAQKFQVQDQTQLSSLQDTDVTSVALQLTQDTTAMNAALAAQAKRPTSTLFDYLPIVNG